MTNAKSGKKILIVEDEPMLLEVLNDEFSKAGFQVHQAKDGVEGMALAIKEVPDIFLVDVLMPKMDGLTMLKQIREKPQLNNIPAIILTNMNDTKTIEQALESGAYDYLVKTDWNPKDLVKHVQEKLKIG